MQEKKKNRIRPKTKKVYKQLALKEGVNMQDVVEDINKSFPINLKNYNVINDLHKKYPLIPKDQMAVVVKSIFEVIRDKSIEGYSVSVKNLFNEFHLIITNNKQFDFVKVSNKTLPIIRKRQIDE